MQMLKSLILKEESGAVALIVALAMSVILGMLLLTVDLGQQQTQKFNTQGAADSSVLVAAQIVSELRIKNGNNNNPSTSELLPKVVEAFRANSMVSGDNDKQAKLDPSSVQVSYLNSAGRNYPDRIRVDGCFITDDKFNVAASQGGPKQHKVCSYAVANLAVFGNAEIVFALDVSASMNNVAPGGSERRIELLRDAVDETVTSLVDAYGGGSGSDVLPETYWGVVPFRGMVDLGTEYSHFVSDDGPSRNSQLEADETTAICQGGDCRLEFENVCSSGTCVQVTTNNTPKIAGAVGTYAFTDQNLLRLHRIPLTARESQDPKTNEAGDSTDDYDNNNRFRSYGSHPYDYWMGWEKEACCGYCKTYEMIAPYNENVHDANPTCTGQSCGCGSTPSSGGSPGGPGPATGGGGMLGGAG